MEYKVLLTGKNNAVIDDFFAQMNDTFESVTTSTRHDDIINHIRCFEPELFIYCLSQEEPEHIANVCSAETLLKEHNVPFAIIGFEED